MQKQGEDQNFMDRGLLDQLRYLQTGRTFKMVKQITGLSEPTLRRILQGQPVTLRTREKITAACLVILSNEEEPKILDIYEERNCKKGTLHETEDST